TIFNGSPKRLFSIGSKKNKKQRPPIVHNVPVPELPWSGMSAVNEEEHEAAVGRLLRSSSARFVESSELNYATLPPLPHPINNVIQTPASSSVSLASTTLSQRGTYNVTVHKRRRHASRNSLANGDLDKKPTSPIEDSRVLRLRSDPSVASLIDLYDEHGKLSADAFSNDSPPAPPREGRAQVCRNGSTLRQLLGALSSLNSRDGNESAEGDISWAERFWRLHTPTTPQFYTEHLNPKSLSLQTEISQQHI
ncbi:hypothetical protein BDZ97DRAFT_1809006, partial [Flammula alnicola]